MARKKAANNANNETPDFLTKAIDALVPDMMKKSFLIGMGCLLLTEEALRSLLSDYKLPKEIITGIIQQSYKTRDEMIRVFREEVRSYTDRIRLDKELKKLAKYLKINIQMEINFDIEETENGHISIQPKIKKRTKRSATAKTK